MANLLPQQYMDLVRKERRGRVMLIVCIALLVTAGFATAFLLPSFVLSQARSRDAERSIELTRQLIARQESTGVLDEVRQTRTQIERLEQELTDVKFSDVLNVLDQSTLPGITLSFLSYDRIMGDLDILTVDGVATTREELLAFKRQLDRQDLLRDVVLPVSNLADSVDVSFSLRLAVIGNDIPEPEPDPEGESMTEDDDEEQEEETDS